MEYKTEPRVDEISSCNFAPLCWPCKTVFPTVLAPLFYFLFPTREKELEVVLIVIGLSGWTYSRVSMTNPNGYKLYDPGGYRWRPTYSTDPKNSFQLGSFSAIFWVPNFRGCFEALNDVFLGIWGHPSAIGSRPS